MPRKVFPLIALAISLLFLLWLTPALSRAHVKIDDITAPRIVSAAIEPSVIDTSYGPATLTLTVRLTDNLSGVESAYYRFEPANPAVEGQSVDVYTYKRDAECQGIPTDLTCIGLTQKSDEMNEMT